MVDGLETGQSRITTYFPDARVLLFANPQHAGESKESCAGQWAASEPAKSPSGQLRKSGAQKLPLPKRLLEETTTSLTLIAKQSNLATAGSPVNLPRREEEN